MPDVSTGVGVEIVGKVIFHSHWTLEERILNDISYTGTERRKRFMKKDDLILELSSVVKSKSEAESILKTLLKAITDSLVKGEAVAVAGFGTFKVTQRKERTGRNPRTGETIQIPACNVLRFSPGKALKDALN